MRLQDALRPLFSDISRARGTRYFYERRVRLRTASHPDRIEATVRGSASRSYSVALDLHGGDAQITCTCPFHTDWGEPCKHAWAAVLAVDSEVAASSASPATTPPHVESSAATRPRYPDRAAASPSPADQRRAAWAPPPPPRGSTGRRTPLVAATRRPPRAATWSQLIQAVDGQALDPQGAWRRSAASELWYVWDVERSRDAGGVEIRLYRRTQKKNGQFGVWRATSIGSVAGNSAGSELDRTIRAFLSCTLTDRYADTLRYGIHPEYTAHATITGTAFWSVLPLLFKTGRFAVRPAIEQEPVVAEWDAAGTWELTLRLDAPPGGAAVLRTEFVRGDARCPVSAAAAIVPGRPGVAFLNGRVAAVDTFGCVPRLLPRDLADGVAVAARQAPRVVQQLCSMVSPPRLELPPPWTLEEVRGTPPRGQLDLTLDEGQAVAQLAFRYGDLVVPSIRPGGVVVDEAHRRMHYRDAQAEEALVRRATAVGFVPHPWKPERTLPVDRLPEAVATLSREQWTIFADGRVFRRAGAVDVKVTSGVDWFDVRATIDFDGATATLPQLLAALRRGEKFVRLDDGSLGMLPEEWLARQGVLLEMGRVESDALRFARTQLGLLDALLSSQPDVEFDANFTAVRDRMRSFEGLRPRAPHPRFVGTLREYQKDGLGWLSFLRDFGWGGCLADDMGLGKTVQVLAALADVQDAPGPQTSLAVVPKSVVFNWVEEARRFVPDLKVLAYHGLERRRYLRNLGSFDLVVTTYQTLRNDVAEFAKREFLYAILDEAQTIKNAQANVAKAVRLIRARHKLALTGTPVENRLSDLWSILDYLNPGMLGAVAAFRDGFRPDAPDAAARLDLLRRAVRPFVLRRTKQQVAPELPPRVEETLVCEMTASQQKKYDELRDFYRARVLGKIDEIGLARAKIHVLEALLRLRQAACHPALLDPKTPIAESGKLEALLPMLAETSDEDHKALVFSQFTSFLALVRKQLDRDGIAYEYLDGQTRDRAARVRRFQTDKDCRLFLISLKAGGLGLNLTAADYVFILDPWWNPAVEAQAIDRTHRIGQDKRVIAYRLIAKGTVEEKILELQARKRDLAASIITASASLMEQLTREDLNVLLS